MLELLESDISCGVYQAKNIKSADNEMLYAELGEALHDLCEDNEERFGRPPFVIFSNTDDKFAKFLAKKHPGSITKTKAAKNPSSGNKIQVFVFQVPKGFLKKHCKCCDK